MTDDHHNEDQTQSFVPLTKGTEVGHYKIISKIGAGGMGEVYLAEDTKLNRQVALKFIPAHLAGNADMRARFTREAQAAAKLDHPNIVPVYEVGEYQGRPYFAMAHIEGKSLRDVIKEAKLGTDDAVGFTMQILEGLQKAHGAGVVHRDIKPGNIIIDKDGRARLVDFGLAMVCGEEKLTKTGSTLGTVGYMSPEQVEGKKCDRRSDLFSVGVVLYEMLTGRRPFEGDNDAAVARAITDSTPEPVARFKSGATGELQHIIDKALTKDPSLRYQHADDMLADLKRGMKTSESDRGSLAQPKLSRLVNRFLIPSLILIIAILLIVLKPWKIEIRPTEEAHATENRLAIMYFDNLTDPDDSLRLGEIATNLLITDLSESEYLNVVSSQHLYDLLKQFGGKDSTVINRDIASQLAHKARARWMLLGNILKTEPNFVITTELIDVSTGNAIATQRIDGSSGEDIFPLIDSLTLEIKKDLNLTAEALDEPDPSISGITTNSQEAYRYYLAAIEDYSNMRFPEMVKNLKDALALDSTFAMAYYWASWFASGDLRKKFIGKAIEYSQQASEKEQLYIKGRQAYYQEDFYRYLEILKQIVERYPDEKEAHYWSGWVYHAIFKDSERALEAYQRVVEIDPLYAQVYNYMAFAYYNVDDFDNSIMSINRYIELSPNSANSYDSKGELLAMSGRLEGAMAAFRLALEIEPEFLPSLRGTGVIHLYWGEYAKAEQRFKQIILHENIEHRSVGRLCLAFIPLYQGKFVKALQVLDEVIAADKTEIPGFQTVQKYLLKSTAHKERGDIMAALQEVEAALVLSESLYRWLEESPQSYQIRLLADNGDFEAALRTAEEYNQEVIAKQSWLRYRYWYYLGYIELSRANTKRSVEYAEKAANNVEGASSEYLRIQFLLGKAYLANGQLGEAVSVFEKIVNRYRTFSDDVCPILRVKLRYWLGMAYEASGWTNKAIEQYEAFLDIWKNADDGLESVEDAKRRLAKLKDMI